MANAAVVVTGAAVMEVVEVADSVADAAVVVVVETATIAENLAIWLVIVATKFEVEVAAAVDLAVVPTTALATNVSNPDTSPATAQTSESVALTPH